MGRVVFTTISAVAAAVVAVAVAFVAGWIRMDSVYRSPWTVNVLNEVGDGVLTAVPVVSQEGVTPATSIVGGSSEGSKKTVKVGTENSVSKTSTLVETGSAPKGTGKEGDTQNQNPAKTVSNDVVVFPRFPAVAREGAKIWSPEELALFDGSDASKPLLLAIVGEVFEVSPGQRFYEPGKGYAGAAGHDASRAFATGAFQGESVSSRIDDLKSDQIAEVLHWRGFYQEHEEYRFVGFLNERYFGPDGAALVELQHVEELKKFQEVSNKAREKFNKRFMSCNSRTGPGLWHEIWCDDSYHRVGSVPAHVYYELPVSGPVPAQDGAKCSCVPATEREALDAEAASLAERPQPGKVTFRIVEYPECGGAQRCKRKKTAEPP